jgi:Tol biopolymer transport system component
MRLPIIPFVIAVTLLVAVWYFVAATSSPRRTLDVPRLNRLADIEGTESEVAFSPDGNRIAVIANGDLWVLNVSDGNRKRMTRAGNTESFPNWSPDGKRVTFSRGSDTFAVNVDSGVEELFRSNETMLSWSQTNRTVFVRDRELWVSNADDQDARKLVDADMIADVEIRTPRFSPDGMQIAFIKSQLGLRGEVWIVDAMTGNPQILVGDRMAENPLDLGWISNGRALAYLTNRAGAYSVWYVDFNDSRIHPLTQPLVTVPLGHLGMTAFGDRIVVPRHFADSNIVTSDGKVVANSEKLEFQPAVSPDEKRVAYTIADENKFEIWTAGISGEQPLFRTLGREPRFSPNGLEIVYTYTDVSGNDDIWKMDIRNGSAERVTDADEIDINPDWSPDGQTIAFASARGGTIAIWTIPASGGKRLRLTGSGYLPRYSRDSKSITFWDKQMFSIIDTDGRNVRPFAGDVAGPPALFGSDTLRDGRRIDVQTEIRETSLWAIDLTYREN